MRLFLDILDCAFMIGGTLLMLLGGIGFIRMPDPYMRMQAAAKMSTLGFALIALATIPAFGTLDVATRSILAIVFLLVTAPIGAHAIARSARQTGVRLWSGSVRDELEG